MTPSVNKRERQPQQSTATNVPLSYILSAHPNIPTKVRSAGVP